MSVSESGGLFKLGHLVPERRPLTVTRLNLLRKSEDEPETVEQIVYGFVFGPTCPGLVKAELAGIHDRWVALTRDEEGQFRRNKQAWHTYLREAIQTLVPALTQDEVDVLAGEDDIGQDGTGTDLLRYLSYWQPKGTPQTGGGDGDNPEAIGGGSTTAESSPISAGPMAGPHPVTGSESRTA